MVILLLIRNQLDTFCTTCYKNHLAPACMEFWPHIDQETFFPLGINITQPELLSTLNPHSAERVYDIDSLLNAGTII